MRQTLRKRMTDELNGLDSKINDRGFFERIMKERERFEAERDRRIEEKFAELAKALELQAKEYSRRLEALNGEYVRDRQRQAQFVSQDKWETTNEAEKQARETALLRVDEKFDAAFKQINDQFAIYITRYEADKREVDLRLAAQAGAAEEAKRAAEDQGRKSNELQREQSRKQSRNLTIAGLLITLFVFGANFIAPVITGSGG